MQRAFWMLIAGWVMVCAVHASTAFGRTIRTIRVICRDGSAKARLESRGRQRTVRGVCDLDTAVDGVCTFFTNYTRLKCRRHRDTVTLENLGLVLNPFDRSVSPMRLMLAGVPTRAGLSGRRSSATDSCLRGEAAAVAADVLARNIPLQELPGTPTWWHKAAMGIARS
jgi:hypothetical protein